jgi:tetratricopeptide (TPR) repeat protein
MQHLAKAGMRRTGSAVLLLLRMALSYGDAGPARLEDSAKDALYDCQVARAAAAATRATELGAAQWDKNKLGCAADIWFSLAEAPDADAVTKLQALLATTQYIDHINTLWSYDLYGVREPEWSARLQHATEHGKRIEARLADIAPDDPNALAARALFKVAWPSKVADTRTQLSETRESVTLLEKAVALDPTALGGNALWVLGRLYYDMPAFAGGDTVKALKLLDEAYRRTPKNISLLRYTAYVYAQEGNAAAARRRLQELVPIVAGPLELQLMADELKNAGDLAVRLGDPALVGQLGAKRDALLKAHTQLLRRRVTAANMHGGVDPVTGKDY